MCETARCSRSEAFRSLPAGLGWTLPAPRPDTLGRFTRNAVGVSTTLAMSAVLFGSHRLLLRIRIRLIALVHYADVDRNIVLDLNNGICLRVTGVMCRASSV